VLSCRGEGGALGLLLLRASYASYILYFLGDPPPDPRFLASLGALSLSLIQRLCNWFGYQETKSQRHTKIRAKRAQGRLGGYPLANHDFRLVISV
jgi:hypothetical protein